MADTNFFPKFLADEIRNDYKRDGEVKTYDALRKSAPPDFNVFYNCDWIDQG